MLHFSHRTLITISGLIWFSVGGMLLYKGLNFLVAASKADGGSLWLNHLATLVGGLELAVIVLVAIALLIGYLKGTRVLAKSADKGSNHIQSLPNPAPVHKMYKPGYFVLLAVMVGLGVAMNVFSVPLDVRGFVDTAVGAALVNGSMVYFRKAVMLKALSL